MGSGHDLNKIDWTDVTRQGAHTANYVDDEIEDFFIFLKDPAQTFEVAAADVAPHGRVLNYFMSDSQLPSVFLTKNILPENFTAEMTYYFPNLASFWLILIGIVDGDLDEYLGLNPQLTPTAFKYFAQFIYGVGTAFFKRRTDTHGRQQIYAVPAEAVFQRIIVTKKAAGFFGAAYKQSGDYLGIAPFQPIADVYNPGAPSKIMLGPCTYGTNLLIKNYFASDYTEFDHMQDAAVTVGISGGATAVGDTAKNCLILLDEAKYINVPNGESIEIDLTAAAEDRGIYEIAIVCDATDANPLSIKFATDSMGAAWTPAVELGDTGDYRWSGELPAIGWTNGKCHVLYPELQFLFAMTEQECIGLRKIKIENFSASDVKVYKVDAQDSMQEITSEDTDGILISETIPPADVPIGSIGTVHTITYRNTADQATTDVHVELLDDGYGPDDILEYSRDDITYYDEGTQPGGGLQLGTGVVAAGATEDWYIRTNIPAVGDVLAAFIARFKYTVVY